VSVVSDFFGITLLNTRISIGLQGQHAPGISDGFFPAFCADEPRRNSPV
jgi:hypothetical protein